MENKNLYYYRLLKNEWFRNLFCKICTDKKYVDLLRVSKTKYNYPRTLQMFKFIDIYKFIMKDDRDDRDIMLDLLSYVSDEDFKNLIETKSKIKI